MDEPIVAVAGATGVVGRQVVAALERQGRRVVPLSRSHGVDLTTGDGLAPALFGVDVVIDVANTGASTAKRARAFFDPETRQLLAAERHAGVGHHVLLSIVGIDGAGGYYAAKLRQERLVEQGSTPWTILRATQFHEFAEQMLERLRLGPVSVIPTGRVRPVAAATVGEALAGLAAQPPAGRATDLRGPAPESLVAMARRTAPPGRRVLAVRLPGSFGRTLRSGVLRGDESARSAGPTFDEWLIQRGTM